MNSHVPFRAPLSTPVELDAARLLAREKGSRVQSIRSSLGNLAWQIVPATEVPERAAPPTMATGIGALDALMGGVPRGALTEIYGPASSGRTSLLLSVLASMTRAGEVCALVDASDSFSPHAATDAGVDLRQLLWVRCNGRQPRKEKQTARYVANDFAGHDYVDAKKFTPKPDKIARSEAFHGVEQALKIADLLLQGGGFGLIAIDFGDIAPEVARRVPMASWFRFRRTVENTPTALVVLEQQPFAKTCASLVLRAERANAERTSLEENAPTHTVLLRGMRVAVEVERAHTISENTGQIFAGRRKPPRSTRAEFNAEAKWG